MIKRTCWRKPCRRTHQNPITPKRQLTPPLTLPQIKVSGGVLEEEQESIKKKMDSITKLARKKLAKLKTAINAVENILEGMAIDDDPPTWQPMAESTPQKGDISTTATLERLQPFHSSLTSCPTEDTFAEDPRDLRVKLMPHQKTGLAWLLWRENQKPSGGILADEMGLGKTLTMISLMLASRQLKDQSDQSEEDSEDDNRPARKDYKHEGGTLVVCPANLLNQWKSEVEKHCNQNTVKVEIYYGPKRETRAKRLAKHDMVVTTYAICSKESWKQSALYDVCWRRVILDEALQIHKHKSPVSIAVCELQAKSRWALTGTPIDNKELDMYALLKFLRCSPFDDLAVWKRSIANKSCGGQDRIDTVISTIMLRRTKAILQETGVLQGLPKRSHHVIELKLQEEEQAIYKRVLRFSRTVFARYLHQHAEKQNDYVSLGEYSKLARDPNRQYYHMHQNLFKAHGVKEVKHHEILVLLLRLRQICCHPSLIIKMLHGDQLLADEDIVGGEEFDVLDEMRHLDLDEGCGSSKEIDGSHESDWEFMNTNKPIFSEDTKSTKVRAVLELLREKIIPSGDKVIIVSQWTCFLRLFIVHLNEANIAFDELNETVPVHKRMNIVDDFNNPQHQTKVLLLSLTAGGVESKLVGANHMILLNLHWNPQVEMQAQDHIYRVGQKKDVHVYKFVAVNTIEERIKALQEEKLADSMLTGSKMQHSKLSLQDLRMLFGM